MSAPPFLVPDFSGTVLLDGAMATALFERGLEFVQPSPTWNLSHSVDVRAVHDSFLRVGCEVVQTNTFSWSGRPLAELVAGVDLARSAVAEHGSGLVAGNLGPLAAASGLDEFEIACRTLADAGVDWISLETLNELELARAQVARACEVGSLPVTACVTLSADVESNAVFDGSTLGEAARALQDAGAVALGLNCSAGSAQVLRALPELLAATDLPVIAKPNAGTPTEVDGRLVWELSPPEFASHLAAMSELGARAVGGCCGSDALYLSLARAELHARRDRLR